MTCFDSKKDSSGISETGCQGMAGALAKVSLRLALTGSSLRLIDKLRVLVPDLTRHYTHAIPRFNAYWEFKLRAIQAFQCRLMLKALGGFLCKKKITVVDIGDSSGTHMLYLKGLLKNTVEIDTISVNLDSAAIERIRGRAGLKAILGRAEDLDWSGYNVDLYTVFATAEHLHNPAFFFFRLAKQSKGARIVVTVPYLRKSRVGLHSIRKKINRPSFAETEHIFELNPGDWKLLLLHAGWKVVYEEIFYQYPSKLPLIGYLLSLFWRKVDFEGFWGVILEKDTTFADLYRDWKE